MNLVRNFFKSIKNIFVGSQESFTYIAIGTAILMVISKISSVFRLQVLTSVYGVESRDLDIFNAANTIPDFVFLIIAIGGVNAALIPVLTQINNKEDENRLKEVFSTIVNIFFLILLIICILILIFAPGIVSLLFKDGNSAEELAKITSTLRVLIFSPIILCISSIFSSLLQIRKRFLITQLAPLFFNLGFILVAIFVLPRTGNNIIFLALGVILGSFLHFLIQLPAVLNAKIDYSVKLFNFRDKYVVKAIKQTLPRILGLSADYFGNLVHTIIAFSLGKGALNAFRLSNSIREIPVTMFGVAISQSIFPKLSELADKKENEEFQRVFSKALRAILFWTFPIFAIFIVLRDQIVYSLYGLFRQNLSQSEIQLVGYSLLFLSFGIIFYSILNLINRAFYALDNTRIPTFVSLFVITIEVLMAYGFVHWISGVEINSIKEFFRVQKEYPLAIKGVALSSSLSIMINVGLLIFFLKRMGVNFFHQSRFIFVKAFSFIIMMIVGFILFYLLKSHFTLNNYEHNVVFTFLISGLMLLVFYIVEMLGKDDDINFLNRYLKKLNIKSFRSKKL